MWSGHALGNNTWILEAWRVVVQIRYILVAWSVYSHSMLYPIRQLREASSFVFGFRHTLGSAYLKSMWRWSLQSTKSYIVCVQNNLRHGHMHATNLLWLNATCCDPSGGWWLYPLEHYMGVLKGWVPSKARVKASIVSGHVSKEAIGFCTKYFCLYWYNSRRVWKSAKDEVVLECVLEDKGKRHELYGEEVDDIHDHVLQNVANLIH